jgi:hypothetical protein
MIRWPLVAGLAWSLMRFTAPRPCPRIETRGENAGFGLR